MKVSPLETTNKFNWGGDTGRMFPEAQNQLYSSNLLCFQIHFKIAMHYTLITKI